MQRISKLLTTENHETMIKLNKPLPKSLATPSAGEHLYMIGSAYYKRDPTTRRYRFHRPSIFLTAIGFIFTRTLAIILSSNKWDEQLIWYGDVSVIMNLKIHFNVLLMTFDYIIVFCHVLHYLVNRRYRKTGIAPNNAPFDLAAGLISPLSIGFNDPQKVYLYAKFVKWSLKAWYFLTRYAMNVFVGAAFYLVFCLKMVRMNSVTIWFVAAAWDVLWTLKSYIFFTYLFYHMLYFYIICFYLRLKIGFIRAFIEGLIKTKRFALATQMDTAKLFGLQLALKGIHTEIR